MQGFARGIEGHDEKAEPHGWKKYGEQAGEYLRPFGRDVFHWIDEKKASQYHADEAE